MEFYNDWSLFTAYGIFFKIWIPNFCSESLDFSQQKDEGWQRVLEE